MHRRSPSKAAAVSNSNVASSSSSYLVSAINSSSSSSSSSSLTGSVGVVGGGGDYRRLTEQEIAIEQDRIIREVAGVLDMPPECARTLLQYYKWSKDKLFDRYYANPKQVRLEAGIQHLGVAAPANKPFMCAICLENCPANEGFGLGCK
jgi:hypothetical protein